MCVGRSIAATSKYSLVREASKNDAEFVRVVGRRIDEIFNPDGHFDETDRARRRGLCWVLRVLTGCRGCGLDRSGDPLLCGGGHRGRASGPPPARRHPGRGA